ncbi:MAG TPA: ABC transporter substrate-binding protein, partial [Bacillota bacterium]
VPIRAAYTVIEEVEVVDEHTVRLHLSQPSPALLSAMSATTVGIISPASVEAEGNTYTAYQHPVGTGPYVFSEYTPGERVVVEKYADYWGEEPYYDRVVFQVVPEAATRMSQLLSGQVDMIILPPVSDIPSLQENPDVEVLLAPSNRTIYIALNNTDEVLSDRRVRQALNYAVDKDAIIQNVLFGAATKLDAPMAPSLFGYCPVGAYEYDPDRARQLLAEAGAENVTLDFIAPTGRYVQDFQAAEAIAGYLRDVGVNVNLRTMDWPTYVENITQPVDQNELDLHLLGWAPGYLDAQQQMVQFQAAAHPPAGLATAFYTNPEVEDLLERAAQELNEETRADLYCQASQLVMDDAPWIFLWYQSFPIVYSADVEGVSYLPNEMFDAVYARPAD